jgi:hypothetical protein
MGDEARQPAVMIAVSVAQNESIEPLGLDAERTEIAQQHLGCVAEVQQVLRRSLRVAELEMQRQTPLAAKVEFKLLRMRPTCSIVTIGCVAFGMN